MRNRKGGLLHWATMGAAVWLTLLSTGACRAYGAYRLTDLGTLGGDTSDGVAINACGQVAGWSYLTATTEDHAFFYNGVSLIDLDPLGFAAEAYGINDAGQITGMYGTPSGKLHAYLYDGSGMQDLGSLGGATSRGLGINNQGQVVGWSDTIGNAAEHAFLYTNGSMKDLGTLGGLNSRAFAINKLGHVTGYSYATGYVSPHAFVYDGVSMKDIGTVGRDASYGYAINDSDQLAGSNGQHALFYDGARSIDLGTLAGDYSAAYGINNAGEIVGYSTWNTMYTSDFHAFLYSSGVMTDLNTLLDRADSQWTLKVASAINAAGQITGSALAPDGHGHAFLLTPPGLDSTPPATTLTLNPVAPNAGSDEYVGPVTVTLTATDPDDPALNITSFYTIDAGARQTYSGPFTVSSPGIHHLTYRSVDKACNDETPHTLAITITRPVTTAALDPAAPNGDNGDYVGPVVVTLASTTPAAGVTIYYTVDAGSQQTYSTPFTVSTVAAHQLIYWGVDTAGNEETPHNSLAFTIVPAPVAPLHTYSGVGWHLISSPYALSQIFAALSITAFAYDPTAQNYVITPTPPADTFHTGQGYWTYLRGSTLDIPGPGTPADSTQPFPITLGQGWNLVGNPFTSMVPLASISVKDTLGDTEPYTVALSNHTVSVLFVYNNASGGYQLLRSGSDIFNAWDGAWIYSKQAGTQLVFNPTSPR